MSLRQIIRVNVLDEVELKNVFFDESGTGKSYALLCHDDETNLPVSSVFQDAFNDGGSSAEFRLIDCNYVLPSSEKSIADKFKLDLKIRPTIFISGNAVDSPKQIPAKHLKTGKMLVKALRSQLEKRAAKIETTQDLRTKCLDKDICGLLLKGTKTAPKYLKDAINKLLVEFPNVSFGSVDASVLYVLNLEEHMVELANEQPRFVVLKKISGSLEKGGSRLITSIAPLPDNGVSYGQMSTLLGNVITGSVQPKKIPSLPSIKTRTKKLVEQERAKRERKQGQQERKNNPQKPATANDGSVEGRRLEREKRRAEHRAKTGFKEKTPEEIAEMERKRRERMEEEAAKWNVAPDDAPEEGDIIDEGEYVEEEEEYLDGEEVLEDEGSDDEDVIDLD